MSEITLIIVEMTMSENKLIQTLGFHHKRANIFDVSTTSIVAKTMLVVNTALVK